MPRQFSTNVALSFLSEGNQVSLNHSGTYTCREVWCGELRSRVSRALIPVGMSTRSLLLNRMSQRQFSIPFADLFGIHRDLFMIFGELERMFGVVIRTAAENQALFTAQPRTKAVIGGGNRVLLALYWLIVLDRILWSSRDPFEGTVRVHNLLEWSNSANRSVWLYSRDRAAAIALWRKHSSPTRTYPNGYKPQDWSMLTWPSGPVSMPRRNQWVDLRNLWAENGVALA